MPTRRWENEEQERAWLIGEIITHEHLSYPADSPQLANHRKTLGENTTEHLREILRFYADDPHADTKAE